MKESIISVKSLTMMFGGDGVYEIDLEKESAQITLDIMGHKLEVVLTKEQLPIRQAETDLLYRQWVLNRLLRCVYRQYIGYLISSVEADDFKTVIGENSFTIMYKGEPFLYREEEGSNYQLTNSAANLIYSFFFVGFELEHVKAIHDINKKEFKKSLKKV